MTNRRARTQEGEHAGDNPATPDVNEAWVETPSESPKEDESILPEPAVVELKTSDTNELKEKQSKEAIEASIQEKLSQRSEEVNPFVPSAQLQTEVKEVATQEGFHLTRGTEAGAALIARSRRQANP